MWRLKGEMKVNNITLNGDALTVTATITPVNALRQIEVTMPWYWSYKSLNKMHRFFVKKAAFVPFNKAQNIYDFPITLWNNNIKEYAYKERFNNAKYRMRK